MAMGTQALENGRLIEIDPDHYAPEIQLKRALLTNDQNHYLHTPQETLPSQWEIVELLLEQLARDYPHYFSLMKSGTEVAWCNSLLQEMTVFEMGLAASLPYAPLDWLGRQVQEDLLLLRADTTQGIPLVAGQLCFPNAWCLEEKLGKSFLAIHQEVPLFAERIGRSSYLLLERLKVGRPVWRLNWAIKNIPRLNLTPRYAYEVAQAQRELTPETIGKLCLLRVERQALIRLPHTQDILFTIHTYQEPIATIAQNGQQARTLLGVLQTTPPEVLQYKGIAPFAPMLIEYLLNQL
ncbi:DUF3445 domain-containing protein [Ktedonobacter sp. SOSP1-52]|uniref:heme-dependent oxidative N-demethylase family protein n=1 Tax=Ktedonobacter sp. SOSP1-52 TaxID=2778366 RepID=UPI001916A11B|nr:DUF3445 domain-containing protein [Ktedonobacter sp. SOSP1-52]